MFRSRTAPLVLAVVAAALLALAPGASAAGSHGKRKAAATARSFSGTVSSVAPRRRTLSLKTSRGATVRLSVTGSTRGVRLRGLKRGQAVTVRASRRKGGWVASRIAKRATPAAEDDQSSDDTDPDFDDDLSDDSTDDEDTPVDGDVTQDGPSADDGSDASGD